MRHRFRLLLVSAFVGFLSSVTARGEATQLGFDRLASFEYREELTQNRPPQEGIPAALCAFDGQETSIRGFMLPLQVNKGRCMEFLLLKDQNACCYGRMPRVNEWVLVKSSGEGVPIAMDVPVSYTGRLSVGARRDSGMLLGVFFLEQAVPSPTAGKPRK